MAAAVGGEPGAAVNPNGPGAQVAAATASGTPALQMDTVGPIVKQRFTQFLYNFTVRVRYSEPSESGDDPSQHSTEDVHEYLEQVDAMKYHEHHTLQVDFRHLVAHDEMLSYVISDDYYRYDWWLRQAAYDVVKARAPDFADQDTAYKTFFVSFHNMPAILRVRELRASQIGRLSSFRGTVTRTSEVRPELLLGVFTCDECNTRSDPVEQQFKLTTPARCRNPSCPNRTRFRLDLDRSRFVDWQRVRVQENSDEIPPGSMPRSVDVVLRHAAVDRAKAGDRCEFTGALVVVPDVSQLMRAGQAPRAHTRPAGSKLGAGSDGVTGLKELGVRDLTYRTAFVACSCRREQQAGLGSSALEDDEGEDELERIRAEFPPSERKAFHDLAAKHKSSLYQRMTSSVAPTVFGHDEVKRGVLLMMLGGVHKRTSEGMSLRGDLNVCVVGDPSTAKSQFLKYTHKFLPRCVYTSGKASSAAGLTASVAKDPETGEFTIEAGALMLADHGVCCIDEFDKMDPADQVAIHEAMEQQTISITKAGIQATLNARTSILAAANPVLGRYDRSKTLRQNVGISPPIMSRFDLFFVVLDDCDEAQDLAIARHIVDVHRRQADALHPDFEPDFMRRYIRYAKTIQPQLSAEAMETLVACYRRLRLGDATGSQRSYRITVRQLESMVRLSEALARLHLEPVVREEHALEAYRLLQRSIIHVDSGSVELEAAEPTVMGQDSPDAGEEEGEGERADEDEDEDEDGGKGKGKRGGKRDKKSLQLTYDQYWRIARALQLYVRSRETAENGGAIPQSDMVNWYLEQQADELESEEELATQRVLINRVIGRLIEHEERLVVVRAVDVRARREGEGKEDEDEDEEGAGAEGETAFSWFTAAEAKADAEGRALAELEQRLISVHPDVPDDGEL